MNSSRNRSAGNSGHAGHPGSTARQAGGESAGAAGDAAGAEQSPPWAKAARSPWTVLCAVAAVVLGPAATTASALEQANKAPLHHAVRVDQSQAYIPADSTRRKLAV
ncbi:hypothetical protein J2X68_000088 [Streptomyces sp. 3330]|uniref:hypothetical protein n=1 Tax=Streptomyces sp. 3330 TaxID=2817755 RepID=UPI00286687B4|nr:hypothetical protein [Streptomyces sp. 3330]MDR6973419.1 hypothetical protein [Streptomyces sp. 3330]